MDTFQLQVLEIVNLVAASFSLLGSVVICFLCCKIAGPKSVSIKLICAIAIADFFYSVANLLSGFHNPSDTESVDIRCYVEAVIRTISYISTLSFPAFLAIFCYKSSKVTFYNGDRLFSSALLCGTIYGLILVLL